jgi:hemerythrin
MRTQSNRVGAVTVDIFPSAQVSFMSEYFKWDVSQYSVNVPEMDREHETLIGLMNAVHEAHLSGAKGPALTKLLGELVAYTRKHFADEEQHMSRIGFPGLRTHAMIHKQLLERIGMFVVEFERTGKLTEDFFSFLKMWLKAHICGIDVKYSQQSKTA